MRHDEPFTFDGEPAVWRHDAAERAAWWEGEARHQKKMAEQQKGVSRQWEIVAWVAICFAALLGVLLAWALTAQGGG